MEAFRKRGVEIREGDISDEPEKLREYLKGVDVLISAVHPEAILHQKSILKAAKEVGVKRVVPSDWGYAAPKGSMSFRDHVSEDYRCNNCDH